VRRPSHPVLRPVRPADQRLTGQSSSKGDTGKPAETDPDLAGVDFARAGAPRIPRSCTVGPPTGDIIDHVRRRRRGFESESERTVIAVLSFFSSVRELYE
jgi:hypothetical protein